MIPFPGKDGYKVKHLIENLENVFNDEDYDITAIGVTIRFMKEYDKARKTPREMLAGTPLLNVLLNEIKEELNRARTKFPNSNLTTIALGEEVGELCKAVLDESSERVRQEAIQVAVMAIRVILDGDLSVNEHRRNKGLDKL